MTRYLSQTGPSVQTEFHVAAATTAFPAGGQRARLARTGRARDGCEMFGRRETIVRSKDLSSFSSDEGQAPAMLVRKVDRRQRDGRAGGKHGGS